MTERVSHEEARALLCSLGTGGPAFGEAVVRLHGYLHQQQALEADTVSRAEHEAALVECKAQETEAWEFARIRESERDDLQTQLTALQAELAAERARAEEAERDHLNARATAADAWADNVRLEAELAAANARAERLQSDMGAVLESMEGQLAAAKRIAAERDAANARAGRLEGVARRLVAAFSDAITKGAPLSLPKDSWPAIKEAEALPSTAPQASTEQASPSPAVVSLGDYERLIKERDKYRDRKRELDQVLASKLADIEQLEEQLVFSQAHGFRALEAVPGASPSPAVGEENEGLPDCVIPSCNRVAAFCAEHSSDSQHKAWRKGWYSGSGGEALSDNPFRELSDEPAPDPTPAEPQGGPEQAETLDPNVPTRWLQSADEHLRSVRPDEPGRDDAVDNALWCILGHLKELDDRLEGK